MEWDGKTLKIQDGDCNRCMHCINIMPKALRPGKEKGATILIGGKAPIVEGALLSWVIVPFMKLAPPYTELKDLIDKIQDWWDEHGKSRERLGELIKRVGMRVFLRAVGLPPVPQMVKAPRSNPYVFFWPEDIKTTAKTAKGGEVKWQKQISVPLIIKQCCPPSFREITGNGFTMKS